MKRLENYRQKKKKKKEKHETYDRSHLSSLPVWRLNMELSEGAVSEDSNVPGWVEKERK